MLEGHVKEIFDKSNTKMDNDILREKRLVAKRFKFDSGLQKFGQLMLTKLKSMYKRMYSGNAPIIFKEKNEDNKDVLVKEEVEFKSEQAPRYFRRMDGYYSLKPREKDYDRRKEAWRNFEDNRYYLLPKQERVKMDVLLSLTPDQPYESEDSLDSVETMVPQAVRFMAAEIRNSFEKLYNVRHIEELAPDLFPRVSIKSAISKHFQKKFKKRSECSSPSLVEETTQKIRMKPIF